MQMNEVIAKMIFVVCVYHIVYYVCDDEGEYMTVMIDKGIAIPEIKRKNRTSYPYDAMDVGDSFFAPGTKITVMCNLQYRIGKRTGRKFTARREGNGVRVWRIA